MVSLPPVFGPMKRNGTTTAGRVRWRCKNPEYGVSRSQRSNTDAVGLGRFLKWLFSKDTQATTSTALARTFRDHAAKYWPYWLLPYYLDHPVAVLHVDGLHLCRKAVVLISSNEVGQPVGWYLARTEHASAWRALLDQSARPLMIVTDGGAGFRKALRGKWRDVRVKRCLFHVYGNITKYTSKNPKLAPGRKLKELGLQLLKVRTLAQSHTWEQSYLAWEEKWAVFLSEQSIYANGALEDTHQKLVAARSLIRGHLRAGELFTFLDPKLVAASGLGALPSTNNRLEGGINAQLRRMLDYHRGMPLLHRVKAIFWWCYMHSPAPMSPAQIRKTMPTDESIEAKHQARQSTPDTRRQALGGPPRWGTVISWDDLHHKTWKR